MSDGASAATREADEDARGDYARMLATLDTAIEEAQRKVESGRVYDAENEKVRIKWLRAVGYLINIRNQVTRDRDLEELAERIAELEALQSKEAGL